MKQLLVFKAIATLVLLSFAFPVLSSAKLSTYLLDGGDKIQITVFGEDDLSMEIRIDDSNTI